MSLLPCPFCGGKAYITEDEGTSVSCEDCGADMYSTHDPDSAIRRWNTRANKDSARLEWVLANYSMEIISPVPPEYPNWKICRGRKVYGEGETAREAIDRAMEEK